WISAGSETDLHEHSRSAVLAERHVNVTDARVVEHLLAERRRYADDFHRLALARRKVSGVARDANRLADGTARAEQFFGKRFVDDGHARPEAGGLFGVREFAAPEEFQSEHREIAGTDRTERASTCLNRRGPNALNQAAVDRVTERDTRRHGRGDDAGLTAGAVEDV